MNTMEAGYAISFVRFGALWKATKRKNAKMKFHFFVLATCITPQNEQTTKRNGRKISFCRIVVLSFWRLVEVDKTNKRQNEQITTTNQTLIFRGNFVVLSFLRALDKTHKRRNEIPFLRFGDLYNATKRTNEEMKSCFCVLSFVRFVVLTNATKRRNEEMKFHFFVLATCTTRQNERTKKCNLVVAFCRLFVLAPWPTRQNEETKKWNSISSFWRLVQRDKTNKRRNEIPFLRFGDLCRYMWYTTIQATP